MDSVDWTTFSAAEVLTFADSVSAVVRELARIAPAPRGAPLFGLDMTIADPWLLDRFSRHGIFRKYQRAVALGSGLGGVQRWWAVHFGCSVLSIDPDAGVIEAAERLGRPTGLAERVKFRTAPLHKLPMRGELFTHAWSVEGLAAQPDPAPALREALRVLRPAGLFSVILPGEEPEAPEVLPWIDAVGEAGFINVVVKRLLPAEVPYAVHFADHALRATLTDSFSEYPRARLLGLAESLAAARNNRDRRVILYAERPS
jgi:ubiquinone/menaquinone biosynthesis C-methylase UbiE